MLADFKKKQMTAIQAFRAYLARTPPFEKPVIAEVRSRGLLLSLSTVLTGNQYMSLPATDHQELYSAPLRQEDR